MTDPVNRCDFVLRGSRRGAPDTPRRCEKRAGHVGSHTFGIDSPDRVVVTRVRHTPEGPVEEVVESLLEGAQ